RAILANGMSFKDKTIETFEGGADDAAVSLGGSPTGYFLRRYIQETTSFTPDNEVSNKHHWIIYRYAETLLSYAESMANAFPEDMNHTDNIFPYSALWAINQVRANADMPPIATCNYDEFIKHLQNEWRVEFAFEDHRFWDIRRWKIADETQRELIGVKITKDAEGKLQYARNIVESRVWVDAMYLYPIPQSELFINNNLYPQNPGW
ncbi:MAG: RagB/SusD family nutrient uptake outer membrane protein, partial [Bacteroides sp.]